MLTTNIPKAVEGLDALGLVGSRVFFALGKSFTVDAGVYRATAFSYKGIQEAMIDWAVSVYKGDALIARFNIKE